MIVLMVFSFSWIFLVVSLQTRLCSLLCSSFESDLPIDSPAMIKPAHNRLTLLGRALFIQISLNRVEFTLKEKEYDVTREYYLESV